MTQHHLAPVLLAELESAFTTRLRARKSADDPWSRGMSLYRKIIRENISGVLQSVFPLFCRRFNEAEICDLVDAILHQHQASQPEFHQLATEMLLFMRQQYQMMPQDLALIEYEWLMYAVEIDDSEVPRPQKMALSVAHIDDTEVVRNPTLRIIALPFRIKEGEPCYDIQEPQHYYALYRKNNHALYQKQLSRVDVQRLSAINNIMAAKLLLNKGELYSDKFSLCSWLETNNNDELLSLRYKG